MVSRLALQCFKREHKKAALRLRGQNLVFMTLILGEPRMSTVRKLFLVVATTIPFCLITTTVSAYPGQ